MARMLALVGLSPEDTGELPVTPLAQEWHLWPCNLHAWSIWCRLQTQWRVGGMGSITGLDYTAVWATLEGLAVRKRREVFGVLQEMERAALEVWREREQQQQTSSR